MRNAFILCGLRAVASFLLVPFVVSSAWGAANPHSTIRNGARQAEANAPEVFDGITIPRSHPRLWWTPARIATAKNKGASFNARDDDHISMAARCFIKNDNHACSAAVQYAMNLDVKTESVSSDAARYFGEALILTFDWCYNSFTPQQRQLLLTRWNGIFTVLMHKDWGGPQMPQNNYFWGYLRNELEWGLATYYENPEAVTFLKDALEVRWKDSFLRHAQADGLGGVPQEGSQYGRYLLQYPVIPFGTAATAGRHLYRETNFFQASAYYVIYSTTAGASSNASSTARGFDVFPFNDDEMWLSGASAESFYYGDFMTAIADEFRGTPLSSHARAWLKLVRPQVSNVIAAADAGAPAGDLSTLPLDYYAPGIVYYYGRSEWGPHATSFNLQLGRPSFTIVGHSHMDAGNWQIWRGGRWLSRESVGYGNAFAGYRGEGKVEANSSIAHNTLLINGVGMAYAYPVGQSIVRRLESRPEYAYVDVDLTPSYRYARQDDGHAAERDNPAASHVEREFIFLRQLETLVIFDRLEAAGVGDKRANEVPKTFLAHFEERPQIVDENHVVAPAGSEVLRLTTLLPSQHSYRVVPEGKGGQYRLEVDSAGTAETYFLHVLKASDRSGQDIKASVTESPTQYVLSLTQPGGSEVTITLRKGMTSSGGSLVINGKTNTLLDRVQKVTVSPEGPSWESLP